LFHEFSCRSSTDSSKANNSKKACETESSWWELQCGVSFESSAETAKNA
jgi:hypothetical protein